MCPFDDAHTHAGVLASPELGIGTLLACEMRSGMNDRMTLGALPELNQEPRCHLATCSPQGLVRVCELCSLYTHGPAATV